ncbi:MAG: hypothetical protein J7K23_05805 [Thermoproteales archaeon]|nr:hypothetical protein [Thermoproteales archaeon]
MPIFKAPLEGVYKVSLDISVLGKGECTVSVDSSIASGDKQGFLAFYSICSIVGFVGLGVVMVYAVWLRVKAS